MFYNRIVSKRHKGAALISVVLVGFVVLSILCVTTFNISLNTMRIERWQRDHYQKQQLQYLAQSGVVAMAHQLGIRYDAGSDTYRYKEIHNKSAAPIAIEDNSRSFKAYLSFDVQAKEDASYCTIKVTASTADGKKAEASCYYNKDKKRLFGWEITQ